MPSAALFLTAAGRFFRFGAAILTGEPEAKTEGRAEQLPLPSSRDDLTDADRVRVKAVTRPATDFSKAEKFEAMSGGAGTSIAPVNQDILSQFSANITFAEEESFKLGNALFRKLWVSSPSSTQASDGLGPLYNARACQTMPSEGRAVAIRRKGRTMRPRCSCALPVRPRTMPSGQRLRHMRC